MEMDLPVDAPAGTSPQLWSVLTAEERCYFGRAGASRALAYGPTRLGSPFAPRGQALDLRV